MKYLLALIALALGLAIGYFVWHPKTGTDQKSSNKEAASHRLVLRPSVGQDSILVGVTPSKQMFSAMLPVDSAEKYLDNYKKIYGSESTVSFSVDSAHVIRMLSSKGLRVYFGLKDPDVAESLTLMVMGIDKDRENVFFKFDGVDYVIDYTNPCPKDCPPIANTTNYDRRTIKP